MKTAQPKPPKGYRLYFGRFLTTDDLFLSKDGKWYPSHLTGPKPHAVRDLIYARKLHLKRAKKSSQPGTPFDTLLGDKRLLVASAFHAPPPMDDADAARQDAQRLARELWACFESWATDQRHSPSWILGVKDCIRELKEKFSL